jgi:GNAT superfamily N-acetyltransferase
LLPDDENVKVLIDAWKVMTGRFPGATFEQAAGVTSAFAYLPMQFFNLSFQNQPATSEAALRDLFSVMRQRATGCAHPSLMGFCQEWLPERSLEIAASEGYSCSFHMTGMAANSLLPPRRQAPNLVYRRVQDDATARQYAMINARAYGNPEEQWECFCNLLLWQPDSYAYVAFHHDLAVAAASSIPVGEVMYIALVATEPGQQGKGYAEAVLRHAIAQGQTGMGQRRIVLHASDMGRPLYQSMGFAAGAEIPLFTPASGE